MSKVLSYGFGSPLGNVTKNTASQISGVTQNNQLGVALPGEWTIQNIPAAGVAATVTKAAGGAGVRHILRSLSASIINNGGATSAAVLVVRDGASGVGTILYAVTISITAVAGNYSPFELAGLNIVGSANTSMTVEFGSAPGANNVETVSASGYDTV